MCYISGIQKLIEFDWRQGKVREGALIKIKILISICSIFLITACSSQDKTVSIENEPSSSATSSVEVVEETGAIKFEVLKEKILTPDMVGVKTGLPVADATSVVQEDGSVLIYFFAQEKGLLSAKSSDLITWTVGESITTKAWGQPRVFKLDDGSIRLFYVTGEGIKSAISKDGIKFDEENGFRISKKDVGFEPGAISIVKLGQTFFGYFSELEKPGAPISQDGYYLAKSTDLLDWEFVGPVTGKNSKSSITGNGKHPFVMLNNFGGVTIYGQGDRQGSSGIIAAVSKDGINFTDEYVSLSTNNGKIPGDPDIFELKGDHYMIFGGFEESFGGFLNIAKSVKEAPEKPLENNSGPNPNAGNPGTMPQCAPGQNSTPEMPCINDKQGNNQNPVDMANIPECIPGQPPDPTKPCRNTGK